MSQHILFWYYFSNNTDCLCIFCPCNLASLQDEGEGDQSNSTSLGQEQVNIYTFLDVACIKLYIQSVVLKHENEKKFWYKGIDVHHKLLFLILFFYFHGKFAVQFRNIIKFYPLK
jgi:hypothetical protein